MIEFFGSPVFVAVAVTIMMIYICAMAKRYVMVGPNEALVVCGGKSGTRFVVGGGTFVIPIIENASTLSLETLEGAWRIDGLRCGSDNPLDLAATLHVKIGRDNAALAAAAEHFPSKSREDILRIAQRVVDTRVREKAAGMAPKAIDDNIDALTRDVRAAASDALGTMGLSRNALTLKIDPPRAP